MVKPDRTMTIDVGRYTAERSRTVYSATITLPAPALGYACAPDGWTRAHPRRRVQHGPA